MKLLKKIKYLLITLYFYIIATLYIVFYGGFVLAKAWFMKKILKKGREAREYVLREIKTFGRRAFSWLFSEVVVHGKENFPSQKPFLIVANHQSIMDIPLILGFIETGAFIAKKELSRIPGVNWYVEYLGGLFVDRGNPRQTAIVLKEAIKRLKEGTCFIIFPEGTRSKDGNIQEFKPGSLILAKKAEVKILPVSIWGTYNLIPKGRILFRPGKVHVLIHPLVDPKNFETEKEMEGKIKKIIAKGIEKLRSLD